MGLDKISWMIGGAQGTGVDSAANIFSRAAASCGFYVFGKREYYSNIKGEHSYFSVVLSNSKVRSVMDEVHLLATFDSETVVRHAWEVVPEGGIIYDPKLTSEKITNIPTIEKVVKARILEQLKKEGLGETVGDVIEVAKRNGVRLYPIPYMDLLRRLGDRLGGLQLSTLARMTNVMAVAASFTLLDLDENKLHDAIRHIFKAKAKIANMNIEAAKDTMEYMRESFAGDFTYKFKPMEADEERYLINGTSAVALGKMVAGCRFQTYYPITPASDESVYLEDHEVFPVEADAATLADNPHQAESEELNGRGSIVVVQTEDEIAAITMATGAALAGARASTATSGPGFSLMAEGLGWAGMNEVPVVVTLYQRGGPSTGLPTRHEQADMLFTIFAGHGEFPRLVIASGDIEEAFYDAIKAFNYAERYQTPVIHLLDKNIANSTMTVGKFDYSNVVIDRGKLITYWNPDNGEYKRFLFTDDNISPRTVLGAPNGVFWNTGDEHDEFGHITEEPTTRVRMMEKRMGKLETADREIPDSERVILHGNLDSPYMIVSWGSTKGPILDAMEYHSRTGLNFAFAQVKLLNPFPAKFLEHLLPRYRMIISVEQNYSGQFAQLLRMRTGIKVDSMIVKYNGRPFSFSELRDTLKKAVETKQPKIVTSTGA